MLRIVYTFVLLCGMLMFASPLYSQALTPKELEAMNDDDHPDKSKFVGVWEYQYSSVKCEFKFKDKEPNKRLKKEADVLVKKVIASMREGIEGVTDQFDLNNIMTTTQMDKKTGKEITNMSMYKLKGDTLYLHSPQSQGTHIFTYTLKGSTFLLKSKFENDLIEGVMVVKLKKIK